MSISLTSFCRILFCFINVGVDFSLYGITSFSFLICWFNGRKQSFTGCANENWEASYSLKGRSSQGYLHRYGNKANIWVGVPGHRSNTGILWTRGFHGDCFHAATCWHFPESHCSIVTSCKNQKTHILQLEVSGIQKLIHKGDFKRLMPEKKAKGRGLKTLVYFIHYQFSNTKQCY